MSVMSLKDCNEGVNIQVVLRCRPPTTKELTQQPFPVSVKSKTEVCVNGKAGQQQSIPMERVFKFDTVFDQNTSQEGLYYNTIRPIVGEVLSGYNCTVFAYGQTGTGKTYTMEGKYEDGVQQGGDIQLGPYAGVIPRAIQHIFRTIAKSGCESTVKLSMLELYSEDLFDMLAPEDDQQTPSKYDKRDVGRKAPRQKLQLFENTSSSSSSIRGATLSTNGGVTVSGLKEIPVHTMAEVLDLMKKAAVRRQVAETKMNAHSSRSHMVTTVTVHIKETTDTGEDLWKFGKLNLVDLAGSENVVRSGVQGKEQKEAGCNNQALVVLGRVINALVAKDAYIPYRASKLTRLLQESLGGKTKTCIIATIAPASSCLEETVSTLEYAHRAKSIKNRPEVNQKMTRKQLFKTITEQNEELRRQLQVQREQNGVYISNEDYQKLINSDTEGRRKMSELEAELENEKEKNTEIENRLRHLLKAHSTIQDQLANIKTQSQQKLASFQSTQSENCSSIVNEIGTLRECMGEIKSNFDASLAQLIGSLNGIKKTECEHLSSTEAQLEDAQRAFDLHRKTIAEASQNILSQFSNQVESLESSISALHEDVASFTTGCAERMETARADLSVFFADLETKISEQFTSSQSQVCQLIEDGCNLMAATHRQHTEEIADSISQQLKDDWVAKRLEFAEFEKEDQRLEEEAVEHFVKCLKRKRQEKQTKMEQAFQNEERMQKTIQSLTDQLHEQQRMVDERSAAIAAETTDLLQNVKEVMVTLASQASERAAFHEENCSAMSSLTSELTQKIETSAKSLQSGVSALCDLSADHRSKLLSETESFVASQRGKLQLVQKAQSSFRASLNQFTDGLPAQLEDCEAVKRRKLTETKTQNIFESAQHRIESLAADGVSKLREFQEMVDGFVVTATTDSIKALENPLMSPLPSPSALITDPQGRLHPRTPLQSIINREFFAGMSPKPLPDTSKTLAF